jgi:hypothetical protein
MVTKKHSRLFLVGEFDDQESPGWTNRYVQDQKGWNAIVFAAQKATKHFVGLQVKVKSVDVTDAEFRFRVLEV